MKQHINFYTIGYIVVLLIATGCKVKRTELSTGYKLEHTSFITGTGRSVFEHNDFRNFDEINNITKLIRYRDYGCDDIVDSINMVGYLYRRGEEGTNVLFQKADKEYAKIKKEMGLESNYREQSDVAEPNPIKIHFYWDAEKNK